MSSARLYDIVVFGATGFTGQLVVRHLAKAAPAGVRWAVAGRSPDKLAAVLRDVGVDVPIVQADVGDSASLRDMAASTRVVLTTVGPYAQYGAPLVAACVEAGCDYVDITGEPEFVEQMIDQHHATAAAKGLRIVSCCGFDSIPHDLGAYFTVQRFTEPTPIVCRGYVRAAGQASGGTWHSAIEAFSNARRDAARRKQRARPSRPTGRRVRADAMRIFHEPSIGAWAIPLPTIDPVIVRRSAAAMPAFGPDFTYGHYARVNELPVAIAGVAGVGALAALAQLPPAKALLLKARARRGPQRARPGRELVQRALHRRRRWAPRGHRGGRRRPGLRRDQQDDRGVRPLPGARPRQAAASHRRDHARHGHGQRAHRAAARAGHHVRRGRGVGAPLSWSAASWLRRPPTA